MNAPMPRVASSDTNNSADRPVDPRVASKSPLEDRRHVVSAVATGERPPTLGEPLRSRRQRRPATSTSYGVRVVMQGAVMLALLHAPNFLRLTNSACHRTSLSYIFGQQLARR